METSSIRTEWPAGWRTVLAAAAGIGFGPTLAQNLSSLFIEGATRDFGWSRTQIATVVATGLLGGLLAPFLGRLSDRYPARLVVAGSMSLLGGAYCLAAVQTGSLLQFQLVMVLLALAVPGTSNIVYGKLIAARFRQHRGLALGLAASGLSVTTLAMPYVIGAVIAVGGWRTGYLTLAAVTAGFALPVVLLLLGPRARDGSDGERLLPQSRNGRSANIRMALTDRRFWLLGSGVALVNLASVGLVTQLVPLGREKGLSAFEAPLLLTSYALSQLAGRVLLGDLMDRYRPQGLAAVAALVSAGAFAAMLAPAPGLSLLMLLVFAAGLMNGAENDLLPYLTARIFGLQSYGQVYGSLLPLAIIGTAGGAFLFGASRDWHGGYGAALIGGALALALAAVTFVTLRTDADA